MNLLVFAAEAGVAVPEAVEKILVEGWWGQGATAIVLALLGYIINKIRGLINKAGAKMDDNAANKEALESLLEGMAKIQEEFVRDAKSAAADGKLSSREITQFRDAAWEHAKTVAKGPAQQIVIQWTKERVSSLIKQLLSKNKGGK